MNSAQKSTSINFVKFHQNIPETIKNQCVISGCEGPTERISSFVDHLFQPIAKIQKSYLKNTTDFLNFIEKTKVAKDTILVSLEVSSLYTNIPREEGIAIVCRTYETFYGNKLPIPTQFLREMQRLILKDNYFHLNGRNSRNRNGNKNGSIFC